MKMRSGLENGLGTPRLQKSDGRAPDGLLKGGTMNFPRPFAAVVGRLQKLAPIALIGLLLLVAATPALAQGFDQFDQGAKQAGKSLVSVIVNVVFVILALACVGFGVAQLLLGRVGLFVVCIIGAIVLAVAPEMIAKTFQPTSAQGLIK
jgi:hypothetical protein